jgi:hypothetical protein
MDPAHIAVFANLGMGFLHCLLTAFQSVRENHFESSCFGGRLCAVKDDLSMKTEEKTQIQVETKKKKAGEN